MSTELENETIELKYRVVSIEKTDPPEGMSDGDWHRYVVGYGKSIIEGTKSGSLITVTEHAETFAEGLNARSAKGNSTYVAYKQK